ncbi:uncharacterized protein BP5553_08521 [Venustampulla echinocandica]|uniref:Uncharacterized protein n=1 Tax=Venustampulla echinocandica TaxID=2656787 RepID=A0A370TEG2_9HELO|nr:uncharacterized protein BP5553_08521 [Venustampulla echinocandica]RDL33082.1 hypothetical protein BP5553_08521 [Venustampulla echinocandica]
MASELKRKRGPVGVQAAPKRAKSVKSPVAKPLQKLGLDNVGWDAAFNPPTKGKELVATNGVNGHAAEGQKDPDSAEPLDYDVLEQQELVKNKNLAEYGAPTLPKPISKTWKLSESIGGRMIDVEPVFSVDEKYIVVASAKAVHVYSTSTSLLTRTIKLKIDESRPDSRIITYCLSPTESDIVWVACSNGCIYRIDWTSGAGSEQWWGISSTGCIWMTVASMESAGRRRDVVFTTESRKDGGWRVTANELAPPDGPIQTVAKTIYTSNGHISFLKTANEGAIIAGAAGNKVLLGRLRSTEYDTIDKIKYEFRIFETAVPVSALDLRVSDRTGTENLKKSILKKTPIVDVVVGDVRGSIFLHNDLLANLIRSQDGTLPQGISLTPRKLHWHRQAVNTVKWSLDGNYVISGGSETVLVLWQLETGKLQFLPHLSATIQNVVISPSGASYGIQLADNSAMVLSTAELQPTTNIAGIQASVLATDETTESDILRVREEAWEQPLVQRTPAIINPADPSKLLLAVGQTQEINTEEPLVQGCPFLQTFDLGSGHNISRQALTRSHTTNLNATPSAHRVSEPRITHMKVSHDGNWLATVDEWNPPARDLAFLGPQDKTDRLRRREVFLKFWEWSSESDTWQLVSRIDAPHLASPNSSIASRVLDLAADPDTLRFSTIGEDNIVCIWSPKTRKREGVIVRGEKGQALRSWNCQYAVPLEKLELVESGSVDTLPASGAIAFSDDGSVLAAVCTQSGLVHLLNPDSGVIRQSRPGLFKGQIMKLDFLGQDLIALSDELLVYDLVADEERFRIRLDDRIIGLSEAQKREMAHLAVDKKSQTFAIALPVRIRGVKGNALKHRQSELFIFHQNEAQPQLEEMLPSVITALLPAVDSDGFLVLDAAADVRSIHKKGSQVITRLAQSTSAQQLEAESAEPAGELVPVTEEADEDEEMEELIPSVTLDEKDEDDDETPVVPHQKLSEIFDIGPAFALPPLEEMFYQVAGLYSSKPLVQSVQ